MTRDCKYGLTQCPSTISALSTGDVGNSTDMLRELCPDATLQQISQSLLNNNGDVNLAAQELLGLFLEIPDMVNGECFSLGS